VQWEKQNGRVENLTHVLSLGKSVFWTFPRSGFSTALSPLTSSGLGESGNPRFLRISKRGLLLIFYPEDWRTTTQNPTSSEINLLQRKNGLDDGVHLRACACTEQ
jgi:hypothetical protein